MTRLETTIATAVAASVAATLGAAQGVTQVPTPFFNANGENQIDLDVETEEEVAAPVVVPAPAAISWLKLLDTYQKNKPPIFKGESDGVTAQVWLDNVRRLTKVLGANPIEQQKLASFSLMNEAGKWYDHNW